MRDDDFGDDHGDREVRAEPVDGLDVVNHWRDDGAVWRDDELEWQVVAPCAPVFAEALGLRLGGADVQREYRLLQRCRVGESAHAREVQGGDGHEYEVMDLIWGLLRLVYRHEYSARCIVAFGMWPARCDAGRELWRDRPA